MVKDAERKLDTLRRRRATIDAEMLRIEAKTRFNKRKADTRRKILVGAIMLREMENDPLGFGNWAEKLLEEKITRPRDRMLFRLWERTMQNMSRQTDH